VFGPGTVGAVDMTDVVEGNAGDLVTIQVISSAGAAAAYHNAGVQLQQ
jgi:hypothetical protein